MLCGGLSVRCRRSGFLDVLGVFLSSWRFWNGWKPLVGVALRGERGLLFRCSDFEKVQKAKLQKHGKTGLLKFPTSQIFRNTPEKFWATYLRGLERTRFYYYYIYI